MPKTTTATKRIISVKNTSRGIMSYDTDNLYPQRTLNILNSSISAYNCSTVLGRFVFGGGLNDISFSQQVINWRNQTVDQFTRKLVADFKKYKGFAILVNYNALFQKRNIQIVPFDYCRLGKEDDEKYIGKVVVYNDWEFPKTDKFRTFNKYNPDPEVIIRQVEAAGGWDKYEGQILYYGYEGDMIYPLSHIEPVREDCLTEIVIKDGKNHNVSTNFLPSTLIQLPFKFKNTTPFENDPDGSKYFNDFVRNLSNFQGFEKSGKFMILENDITKADGEPLYAEFKDLPVQKLDELYKYTEESIANNIRKAFQIPTILLEPVSTGFSTEIMSAAYNLYNNITYDYRLILEETLKNLFTNYEKPVNLTNDYSIKPLQLI